MIKTEEQIHRERAEADSHKSRRDIAKHLCHYGKSFKLNIQQFFSRIPVEKEALVAAMVHGQEQAETSLKDKKALLTKEISRSSAFQAVINAQALEKAELDKLIKILKSHVVASLPLKSYDRNLRIRCSILH